MKAGKLMQRGFAFLTLFDLAQQAGMAAGLAATPVPMVVGTPTTPFGSKLDYTKETYFVPDGVCGFAWVKLKGNTAFGKWAKQSGRARPDYPNGLAIRVAEFGQSMQRKEAYAQAFAKTLRGSGIDAWAESRMD